MQNIQHSTERLTALAVFSFYLGLLPLLIWIPTYFPHAEGVVSAAQTEGYNNKIAHLVTLGWAIACFISVYLVARTKGLLPVQPDAPIVPPANRAISVSQMISVTLVIIALYFPPALARYGPYGEDLIHISAIHRMLAGDVPYSEFEFLYGPLMLFPAYFWTLATDFSLVSFYSYVALLEVVVFLAVLRIVQLYLPRSWERLGAFLLIAALYLNPLIGPNQNGLRKVAGVALLLSVATRPWSPALWVLHGVGVGALMSYSQDFGAATALGIVAVYSTLFFKTKNRRAILALSAIALVSALTWIAITWALLGSGSIDYFKTLAYLTARFDAGEAAFRFYWTASSLGVFGLLFLAIWHVSVSFARPWEKQVQAGDLVFVGGIVYALVMLKSGLSRADQWHLVPSILVLVFCFVLPIRSDNAPVARTTRRIGLALSLVVSLSYSLGHYPQAKYVFRKALLQGYADFANSSLSLQSPMVETARPALAYERSHPDSDLVSLSEFLAEPQQRNRRIFIYGGPWGLPPLVGATKAGPLGDDYIYGDDRGEIIRTQLDNRPETLVIIHRDNYKWLLEGPDAAVPPQRKLGKWRWRRLAANISSVHVPGVVVEEGLKLDRWRRLAGLYVVENYQPVFTDGRFYVLTRKPAK
jgi:hypothetical protein